MQHLKDIHLTKKKFQNCNFYPIFSSFLLNISFVAEDIFDPAEWLFDTGFDALNQKNSYMQLQITLSYNQ